MKSLNLVGVFCVFIIASACGNDSFVFPEELNIPVNTEVKPKLSGNEEVNGFRGTNEFNKYGNTGYDRPGGHGHHFQHKKDFRPHDGFHGDALYDRPVHPSYSSNAPGIVNQGYQRPSGISQANAQSNAQASNGYVNSNAQANSQSQFNNYGSPYYPSNGGASSASSAASATTGIVNGRPVAAASAAAAAAGADGSSSSSSGATSSASGNYGDGAMSPWFYRSRIASDEVKEDTDNEEDDKITFLD